VRGGNRGDGPKREICFKIYADPQDTQKNRPQSAASVAASDAGSTANRQATAADL